MNNRKDGLDTAAGYDLLEILKDSPKGTVSLIYDARRRRMLVEKRLNGALNVYRRLLALAAFFLWGYQTDTELQETVNIALSSRRALVFGRVDIKRLERSNAELEAYTGDAETAYRVLAEMNPDLTLISTGYADEEGRLLFGGFSTVYEINTGHTYYQNFVGLYAVTAPRDYRYISPEDCTAYAPAVLALYHLDTFDTPLF